MTSIEATREPLRSHLADDPDLAELVTQFVAEMPQRAARLEAAARDSDRGALRRLAHQMRGAAGSYGFPPLSRLAERLELAIDRQHGRDAIAAALAQLLDACRRVEAGSPAPHEIGAQ